MTPSEEIITRYARIEREADAFGRIIGVRKLKISQQTKVSELTPGLEGSAEVELTDKRIVTIARRTQMLIAAAVCEIDQVAIPFPKSRGELDAIADRLDEEGLVAAMVAYARLSPQKADGEADESGLDAAKK